MKTACLLALAVLCAAPPSFAKHYTDVTQDIEDPHADRLHVRADTAYRRVRHYDHHNDSDKNVPPPDPMEVRADIAKVNAASKAIRQGED